MMRFERENGVTSLSHCCLLNPVLHQWRAELSRHESGWVRIRVKFHSVLTASWLLFLQLRFLMVKLLTALCCFWLWEDCLLSVLVEFIPTLHPHAQPLSAASVPRIMSSYLSINCWLSVHVLTGRAVGVLLPHWITWLTALESIQENIIINWIH